MPVHSVAQGECLASIAAAHGFRSYLGLYEHPDNAALRALRPNPNVLLPGDRIAIPPPAEKRVACATDAVHRLVVRAAATTLRLALVDRRGAPLADRAYVLRVGASQVEGRTDAAGSIRQHVPPEATSGQLKLWLHGEPDAAGHGAVSVDLHLGALDPIDTTTGVQARLNNLGYDCGSVDGLIGPQTARALRDFQRAHRLEASGRVDDATRGALAERHDG